MNCFTWKEIYNYHYNQTMQIFESHLAIFFETKESTSSTQLNLIKRGKRDVKLDGSRCFGF